MSNDNMVVIYCPRHEMVMSGNPVRLHQAGWRSAIGQDYAYVNHTGHHPAESTSSSEIGQADTTNVICLERWKNGDRPPQEAVPVRHR
jgi:hypothetical protein